MPQGLDEFRYSCCQQLRVALGQADRPTLVIMVKPPDRRRRTSFYTASLNDKDGRLLAACRHELGPFDGQEFAQRIQSLVWEAFGR